MVCNVSKFNCNLVTDVVVEVLGTLCSSRDNSGMPLFEHSDWGKPIIADDKSNPQMMTVELCLCQREHLENKETFCFC